MVGDHTSLRRRPPFKLGGAALGSALLVFFAACYSPDLSFDDCMLPCLKDCPTGAECRNNFCVHTGSSATCAAGGSGGSGGSATAGTGGEDSGVGGSSEPTAGSSGDTAGAAGDPGGATPFKVDSAPLASLCPGQAFQVELSAQGGVAPYTWALADGTPTDIKLSATTGDSVQVSGIAIKAQPNVRVTTHDASGSTTTTVLALSVDPVGPGECPQITSTTLPDPCEENPYSADRITVVGGTAPFVWTALSIPDGLTFDAARQVVSGTALSGGAATPLTLKVTDKNGRQTQLTYSLAYRDKCWLGYTSTDNAVSRVHLYDPALDARVASLETSTKNAGVTDFRFSPDGKFLAYRRTAEGSGTQSLVLAIAPHWQEQELDLGGSVLSYAWSASSTELAVAFQNSTDTLLGGVDVSNAVASSTAGGITGIQPLQSVVMIDRTSAPLHSDLIWFQSDTFLAFHADALLGPGFAYDTPYFTHFDGTGFSSVAPLGSSLYDPAMQVLPAKKGIFVVSPETPPQIDFYGSAGGNDLDVFLANAFTSGVTDPAGLYVALPLKNKLQIFLTAESGGTTDPPTAWQPSADDCNSILAWDPSRERIACDARETPPDGGTGTGEVRIFDLVGTNAVPQVTSTPMKLLSGYQQGDSAAQRRLFSEAGHWLAFATATELYLANVQEAPQVVRTVPLPDGASPSDPSELAFAPDENMILWQKGQQLGLIQLQTNGQVSWVGAKVDGPLRSPTPCNEEFTMGPDKWCGRRQSPSAPEWSPDSRFAAARTATQGVRVYNLERFLVGLTPYREACVTGCFGDFEFQP
jgi:hypothetical protein